MRRSPRKVPRSRNGDSIRAEYDLTGGVRGKHAARYAAETNVVVLDPDVAAVFPNSVAVNDALRALVQIVQRRRARKTRSRKSA